MDAVCLTCGTRGPVEGHHIAGRYNDKQLVVPVCVECHLILTNWQYASGIELGEAAPRSELDVQRAVLVGALHVIQLYAQRHSDYSWLSADLATLMSRVCSKLLDDTGDPDREGRWLPDPTYPVTLGTVTTWNGDTEDERVSEFAWLVLALGKVFGDMPTFTASRLRQMATRPADFRRAFAVIARDDAAMRLIAIQLADYIDAADALVRRLLLLPDPPVEDATIVEDAAAYFEATSRLGQTVFDLADAAIAAQRKGEP